MKWRYLYQFCGLLFCYLISKWAHDELNLAVEFKEIIKPLEGWDWYIFAVFRFVPIILLHETVHYITLRILGGDGKFWLWTLPIGYAAIKITKPVYGYKFHIVAMSAPLMDLLLCFYFQDNTILHGFYLIMVACNFLPLPMMDGGHFWIFLKPEPDK
jgi:hypothetical protein